MTPYTYNQLPGKERDRHICWTIVCPHCGGMIASLNKRPGKHPVTCPSCFRRILTKDRTVGETVA